MRKKVFKFWVIFSLFSIFYVLIFDLCILLSSEEMLIQFIPDDTFYYLQLAKNFSKLGYWTFDSGISVTSGFHPLLAYLYAGVYHLFAPKREYFVLFSVALSIALALLAVLTLWYIAIRRQQIYPLVLLSLFLSANFFLLNSVSGLEWSLVIFLTSMYYVVFYFSKHGRRSYIALFTIGFLLSFARADSGLFPFFLFVSTILMRNKNAFKKTVWGLVGALSGLFAVFINNYLFTGNWIQSSAKVKAYWGQFQETTFSFALRLIPHVLALDKILLGIPRIVNYWAPLSLLAIWSIITIYILSAKMTERKSLVSQKQSILFIASFMSLIAYVLFYSKNGDVQLWYTQNITIAIYILSSTSITIIIKLMRMKKELFDGLLSIAVVLVALVNWGDTIPLRDIAPWKHQVAMLQAGKYLSSNYLPHTIGAWNAGIIGYYADRKIVNLDGLVNDDIYAYIISNRLPEYLYANKIDYIIDFQAMFSENYARRGGYKGCQVYKCVEPVQPFGEASSEYWQQLTLYKVQQNNK